MTEGGLWPWVPQSTGYSDDHGRLRRLMTPALRYQGMKTMKRTALALSPVLLAGCLIALAQAE